MATPQPKHSVEVKDETSSSDRLLRSALELNLIQPNRFFIQRRRYPSDAALRAGTAPVPKLITQFKRVIGGTVHEVTWRVSPNPDYGLPRAFTKKVEGAIVHLAYCKPRPVANPIQLGSLSTIAYAMGLTPKGSHGFSGAITGRIKHAIEVLASTTHKVSVAALYEKEGDRINTKEVMFHLLNRYYFEGDRFPDGSIANTIAVDLDPLVLSNINTGYVRPIDWTYLRSLNPSTARCYEFFGQWVYSHIRTWREAGGVGEPAPVTIRYSALCERIGLSRQRYKSRAIERCIAFRELVETQYFSLIEWEPIRGVPDDWQLVMHIGQRALREHVILANGPRQQLSLFEPAQPVEGPADIVDVTAAVASSPAADGATPPPSRDEVRTLVRSFYEERFGSPPRRVGKIDRTRVEELLADGYSPSFITFLWRFAAAQVEAGKPAPDRPGGAIELYLPQAEAVFGRRAHQTKLVATTPANDDNDQVRKEDGCEARFDAAYALGSHQAATSNVHQYLRSILNDQAVQHYTGTTMVLKVTDHTVAVAVRDRSTMEWIQEQPEHRDAFEQAIHRQFEGRTMVLRLFSQIS